MQDESASRNMPDLRGDEPMTKDVAFAVTNAIAGLIEAMGMQAENQFDQTVDRPPSYTSVNFQKIIEERGLGTNDLIIRILHSE